MSEKLPDSETCIYIWIPPLCQNDDCKDHLFPQYELSYRAMPRLSKWATNFFISKGVKITAYLSELKKWFTILANRVSAKITQNMSKLIKYVIALVVIVAILTIAAPIYYYVKDFGELSRSTDPADWGSFGDYFGGTLNPIISLLTLIVTIFIAIYLAKIDKRNHEETVNSTVKPLFTIEPGHFFSADLSAIGPTIKEDYYSYEPPKAPAQPHDYFTNPFYLRVANKGLGIATHVNVTFEIDLNDLKKVLLIDDAKLKITSSELATDEDGNSFIILQADSNFFNYKVFYNKILSPEKVGLGVVDKEVEVPIPGQIMGAFQFFHIIRRLKHNENNFPVLNVTFTYKNIHGKELTTKFRVGLFHIHDYMHYSMFKVLIEQI